MINMMTLLLMAVLGFECWRDAKAYKIFSASLLAVVLIYIFYCFLIELLDISWHIVALPGLSDDFIISNLTIILAFSLAFIGGKRLFYLALSALRPIPREQTLTGLSSQFPQDSYVDSLSIYGPFVLGAILFAINLDGWWLFDPYPTNNGKYAIVRLEGASILAVIFVSLAAYRSVVIGRGKAIILPFVVLMAIQYVLAGDRDSFLFVTCGMYLIRMIRIDVPLFRKIMEIILLVIGILVILETVSQLRGHGGSEYGSFITEVDLVPYGLSHMVYGIQLSDFGGGKLFGGAPEFLGTLIIQIVPSQILTYLGIELYNGPWMLSAYVSNPGGFFIPAELYFLGGLWMVCVIAVYIGMWSAINDYIFKRSIVDRRYIVSIVIIIASISIGYALFYGMQTLNRMMTLPLIFYFAVVFFSRRISFRRSPGNSVA